MSLIMITLFIIVAIVGRSLWQNQLTGDSGMRPVKRNSPLMMIFSSALIILVFIAVIIISLLTTFAGFEVYPKLGIYGNSLGILFCLVGILLTSLSQIQMGTEWRIGVDENEKTKLITHGVYSKIRNPIYTGVIIFGLGLVVLIPNIIMIMLALLGYAAIELHVRKVEEPHLEKLHGQLFTNYKNSTGRYFPRRKKP
ncbi:MAG: isoprenylcysteine carboxylmethyltransferase family protein [Gammaproteobacteria bacterium]|nr:isoprenylcysteine carboxylmethyltransferase family protein [Gammaproteobacteria bacterium]